MGCKILKIIDNNQIGCYNKEHLGGFWYESKGTKENK